MPAYLLAFKAFPSSTSTVTAGFATLIQWHLFPSLDKQMRGDAFNPYLQTVLFFHYDKALLSLAVETTHFQELPV